MTRRGALTSCIKRETHKKHHVSGKDIIHRGSSGHDTRDYLAKAL